MQVQCRRCDPVGDNDTWPSVATNPGVLAEGMLHVLLDEDGCKARANIPQLQLEGS